MKLELKENMYVRTKDGIIANVDYIDDNTIFFDKDLYRTYGDSIDFLEKDNLERIVKASYNIIDVLEVGDVIIDKERHKYPINYEFETDYNSEYSSYEITIDDHITLFLKEVPEW